MYHLKISDVILIFSKDLNDSQKMFVLNFISLTTNFEYQQAGCRVQLFKSLQRKKKYKKIAQYMKFLLNGLY